MSTQLSFPMARILTPSEAQKHVISLFKIVFLLLLLFLLLFFYCCKETIVVSLFFTFVYSRCILWAPRQGDRENTGMIITE